MNACDDGSNPLGECCDVPRSGVAAVMAAADKVAAPARAVTEIRELHECESTLCINCSERWPCSTIAILERHGL